MLSCHVGIEWDIIVMPTTRRVLKQVEDGAVLRPSHYSKHVITMLTKNISIYNLVLPKKPNQLIEPL